MLQSEEKVASSSAEKSSAVISKIQNMTWLKRPKTASTHPKSNYKTEDTMLKSLPQKEKDGQFASDKNYERKQRKPRKQRNAVPPKNDNKFRGNGKSKAEGPKNNQAGKKDIKAPDCSLLLGKPENAWNPEKNAAETLFPNVDAVVTEVDDDEMLQRAIEASMETAFLEKCAIDPPEDEAAGKTIGNLESEAEWGQVQKNLPAPEPGKELETSDRNSNAFFSPIEDLTVPAVKLERRSQIFSDGEIQSKNEAPPIETFLVPPIPVKFIDQYGRVDGCTGKHLFMGKGARFKEQEYLKQLQQQQQQQLKSLHLFPEDPVLLFNASDTSSDPFEDCQDEHLIDALDDESSYSRESQNESEEISSEIFWSTRSVDQGITKKIEPMSNSSQYSADPSSVSDGLASEPFKIEPEAPVDSPKPVPSNILKQGTPDSSEDLCAQNLKQETQDFSLQDSGSESKKNFHIPEQTSGEEKQNSYISEQRPTQQGDLVEIYKQKRYETYHDARYGRGPRPEQNFSKTYGRDRGNDFGGPKDDRNPRRPQGEPNNYRNPKYEQNPHKYGNQNRGYLNGPRDDCNFQKSFGEQKRDFPSGPRADQNPYKWKAEQRRGFQTERNVDRRSQQWGAEQKRDYQKETNVDRSCQIWEEENKRDSSRRSTYDQIPLKSDDHDRDFHGGSRGDRSSYKPDGEQKRNSVKQLSADSIPFEPANASTKTDANNEFRVHSLMKLENLAAQNESKDFKDSSENISEVPDISNFVSRFSVPLAMPEYLMKKISVPPAIPPPIPPPTNSFSAAPVIPLTTNSFSVPPVIPLTTNSFSVPPVIPLTTNSFSVPPVVPLPSNSFTAKPTNSFTVLPTNSASIDPTNLTSIDSTNSASINPTNPYAVTTRFYCPEMNNAARLKENVQSLSPQFPTPPGFQSVERAAQPSCDSCQPRIPLEARYANLQMNDPLLFRLLQQTEAPIKVSGSCPNCSCNSPRNFNEETMNTNVKTCQSEKEEEAKFQTWDHSDSPPINQYLRNQAVAQYPETLQMDHVENNQWIAPNMRHPNIPLHENLQLVTCLMDCAGNIMPVSLPMPNPYQHAQRTINEQPRGEEYSGFVRSTLENVPQAFQSLVQQRMLTYPYGHQAAGMPFPPHIHGSDIATMSQSNVVQGNPNFYRESELHQNPLSMGVDFDNQKVHEKLFPLGRGAGVDTNIKTVPIESRGRGRRLITKK